MFSTSMDSMTLQFMVYAKVQCIDVKPLMPEYVYDEGNWKYVEICGRVKDLGCSEWFPSICERLIYECISRSRTMEVAVVICCAYE